MKLKRGLVLRHIGNDFIIVDPGQGVVDMTTVYTLNKVGAWLWRELEGKDFTVEQMAKLLTTRYGVPFGQAVGDMDVFTGDLIEKGLIIE